MLDLTSPKSLILEKGVADTLQVRPGRDAVSIDFGNASVLDAVTVEPGTPSSRVTGLTSQYATELEQIPIGGVLGIGAFGLTTIELDISSGLLGFGSIPSAHSSVNSLNSVERSYQLTQSGLLISKDPLSANEPEVLIDLSMFCGIASPDALSRYALFQAPTRPLLLGSLDLLKLTAFRVSAIPSVTPATTPSGLNISRSFSPSVVLGMHALQSLLLTIDTTHQVVGLTVIHQPVSMSGEQTVMIALHQGQWSDVENFLLAHGDSWLYSDLSYELVQHRMADPLSSTESITSALQLYDKSLPDQHRAKIMISLADQLINKQTESATTSALAALDIAQDWAAKDLSGTVVHEIQARQGLLAMRAGDLKRARRLLLAATIGMPNDQNTMLLTARLFRKLEQNERAWSKYADLSLTDNPPAQGIEEWAELNRDQVFRSTFHAIDAEMIMDGRTGAFVPAKIPDVSQPCSVRLVEVFVNSDIASTGRQSQVYNALRNAFLPDASTLLPSPVFIAYHLDSSLSSSFSKSRAAWYEVNSSIETMVDGIQLPDNHSTNMQALFDKELAAFHSQPDNRAAQLIQSRPQSLLQTTFMRHGSHFVVKVQLNPPATVLTQWRVHVLLVERCVPAPLKNGEVLHYAVVRDALTGSEGVSAKEVADHGFTTDIDTNDLIAGLGKDSAVIDAGELQMITFVQDAQTHRVITASQMSPEIEMPGTNPIAATQKTALNLHP